ncbi:MAG: DUF2252 domain-containing protein, partial [Vulcanimicrobiaceae bacterium]
AWEPPPGRRDPLVILHENDAGRLPDLLPLRYERMLQSPFTFYRGAAAIMAEDLAATPMTGLRVQLCGDAHLLNFGAYASPERNLVFDVNDFDETNPGPWEWDLKRLATSVAIAARLLALRAAAAEDAVRACVASYRERMLAYAAMPVLDVWYARLDEATLVEMIRSAQARRAYESGLAKGKQQTAAHAFPKLTQAVAGERRFVDDPPLTFHPSDRRALMGEVRTLFTRYAATLPEERRTLFERFTLVDAAYKVVGVGSVGTRCLVALFLASGDDPLFLQIKEARTSVLAPFAGPCAFADNGERVVVGQRLMQAASDIFLGWAAVDGTNFYVRQLRDMKTSANVERMSAVELATYGGFCGWALARAHARSSGEAAALAGYLGGGRTFDSAIVDFANAYADQNQRDYEALVAAAKSGRVPTAPAGR